MKIDTNDMLSVTDANSRGISWLVNEAGAGRNMVVLRNNVPAAVVVGPHVMERLQSIDEIEENLRLLAVTLTRIATDSGERYGIREIAAKFGVDLDDDAEDSD